MAPRLGRLVIDAEIEGCDPSTDTPLPVKVAGTTSSGEEATLTQGMYPGEPLSIEPGAYEVAVLRVPDDSGVTYRIGERSLWEGTGTYVWLIEFYQEGKAVASAFCTYDGPRRGRSRSITRRSGPGSLIGALVSPYRPPPGATLNGYRRAKERPVKVLIVPNNSRPDATHSAVYLEEWLDGQGIDVVWAHDKRVFPDAVDDATGCDLVVSLGGDGTLLRAARIVGYSGIPILGISYGHLGFLTAAGPEDLIEIVRDALAGELHVSRRATLDIECEFVDEEGVPHVTHHFALNDFALSRGGMGDMVEFDVDVSGHHIDRLRGDGFVVSTATGSTGYALAAGGPIVTPEFTGMVCVPIAPHTILARAFLTSPADVVEITMSPERPVMRHFFVDGRPVCGEWRGRGTRAAVRRGPGDVVLLDRGTGSFYNAVSRVFYGQVGK